MNQHCCFRKPILNPHKTISSVSIIEPCRRYQRPRFSTISRLKSVLFQCFINLKYCQLDVDTNCYFIKNIALCKYINKNENTTMTNTLKRSVRSVRLCFWSRTLVTYSWIAVCIIVGSSDMSRSASPSSSLLHSYINNGNIDFGWQQCTTWTSFVGYVNLLRGPCNQLNQFSIGNW